MNCVETAWKMPKRELDTAWREGTKCNGEQEGNDAGLGMLWWEKDRLQEHSEVFTATLTS